MEYREFGKTGFKVSIIGMGTYYDPSFIILARLFNLYRNRDLKVSALRKGIELGINLIDTAEIYETESLVAEAIEGFRRDGLFIATKVWPTHLHYDDVLKAAERSLKRLRCSYIDLYQIHFPNPRVPLEETMRAMNRLVDEGKVRYIGVSNFSLEQLKKAQGASPRHEIVSIQIEYSLLKRRVERSLLPYCEKNKIAMLAYRPLAHGRLAKASGKLKTVIEEIGLKYGGKTPAQIALNWLVNRSRIVFPIPRASRPERIVENSGATGWRLDEEDMEKIFESCEFDSKTT
ncbi:MAG: aldo/keto reductase [Candidatus Brockarchaeota archaeon]|nr:aldo/keto reductase [Candidatus Brockarchaeota archaeon]